MPDSGALCSHGYKQDIAYWHAWQEGRAVGWSEAINRPFWWMRLTCWLRDLPYRLTHRQSASPAQERDQ